MRSYCAGTEHGTITGHNRASEPMAEDEQNPRVLVVDDEPNIRELVQVALKFHGCAVTTGATGKDALRLAAADAGPDRARRHAPRYRRLRGLPPAARGR